MSIAGGHDQAVRAAKRFGCQTVQLFTKSSNQWRAKPLLDEHVELFRAALAETGIIHAIGHDSYLINLGSPDEALWEKSIESLVLELTRGEALGLQDLVVHPGSHVGSGEEIGLTRIAKAINRVHRRTRGFAIKIALETTAGQGSSLGHRFEHLEQILGRVAEPERIGVCCDTCHLFAAGYSLAPEDQYNETIAALDLSVGVSRVRVWHVNDSQRPCGSRVDRHAGIGRGMMGLEPFKLLLNDPRFRALPMILETPKGTENGQELDTINLQVLRELCGLMDHPA
jgi:deoxyribonuclease IV